MATIEFINMYILPYCRLCTPKINPINIKCKNISPQT